MPLAAPCPYQKVNKGELCAGGGSKLSFVSAWPPAGALATTPPPPAALVTALPPAAALEQKACAEQEPWLVVYLLLGLCLCALICSLVLGWTHLRRKGEVGSCQAGTGTCHRREDSSKGECWGHREGTGSWGWLALGFCQRGAAQPRLSLKRAGPGPCAPIPPLSPFSGTHAGLNRGCELCCPPAIPQSMRRNSKKPTRFPKEPPLWLFPLVSPKIHLCEDLGLSQQLQLWVYSLGAALGLTATWPGPRHTSLPP